MKILLPALSVSDTLVTLRTYSNVAEDPPSVVAVCVSGLIAVARWPGRSCRPAGSNSRARSPALVRRRCHR
ncbi:hypothetical protein [Dactylosporangium sp. NPDC005555]|uniref:hypothetical protein n=1 Tax=Dactylosporangium sp. NPDC005555 TaxID=3154889 RepID=UPI0033B33525